MRGMDEARATQAATPVATRRDSSRLVALVGAYLPVVATLAAIGAFSFVSGGYIFSSATIVVFVYGAGLIAWLWLAPRPLLIPKVYLVGLAAFAAFAVWEGLSVVWSVGPDLSWIAFDYASVYLLAAAAAAVIASGRVHLRVVGYGYLGVASVVAAYAFLGKALPDVVTHAHTYARLDSPVGYWNVLALMMVMAIPVALAAAGQREHPVVLRATAAACLAVLLLTFFFSYSRGGYIALAVCLAVYFALATTRLGSLLSLALAAGPVGLVLFHVRGLETVFSPTTDDAMRTAQGHVLGRWALLAIAVVVVAQVVAALVHRRVQVPRATARFVGAFLVVAIVVGVAAGAFVYAGSRGGMVHWVKGRYEAVIHDTDTRQAGGTPGRLLSLNSGRPSLWHEALKEFPYHPLTGTGAGTFRFTHYLFRSGSGVVKHAHSEWLNVLSELGLIGLGLFVVAIGAFVAAAFRRVLSDRRDADRSLLAAMQAAVLAFVIHMSWDWDWDMAAATLVFLLFAGTLASYLGARGRPNAPPDALSLRRGTDGGYGWVTRALTSGLLVLILVSWALPYSSGRAYSAALLASGNGRLAVAEADAREAHRLDPLTVDPLVTLALLQQQLGEGRAALSTLDQAVRLQPQNYEVYYQRGMLYTNVFGDYAAADQQLRIALRLNPYDALSSTELQALRGR